MILPRREDVKHKTQMFRLLREILKNPLLSNNLMFKGGTYAALRDILDRFSVDLDFDLPDNSHKDEIRQTCEKIFKRLNLEMKDSSKNHLQFFLRYNAPRYERNTLKLEITDDVSPENKYERLKLKEVEMFCKGHTLETMFANKLVAAKARFNKTGNIAGRDFYDIHKFFEKGLSVNVAVVEERTGIKYVKYLEDLRSFIEQEITDRELFEDLNTLLPQKNLKSTVKILRSELRFMINDEIKRFESVEIS